ncbi:divalent metal cation transporter [Bradyrhizobium sp. 13971]
MATAKAKRRNRGTGFLKRLGPGLITGASDDDPSGIGTYSQAGAQLGFGIGWTMLLSYPLMVAIQEISGRIGRVTGHLHRRQSLSQLPRLGHLVADLFSLSPTRSISQPISAPWRMRQNW